MNKFMQKLWIWQARSKIGSTSLGLKYPAIHFLGEYGSLKEFETLISLLKNPDNLIRISAIISLKHLLIRFKDEESIGKALTESIIDQFNGANGLIEKISTIELLKQLPISIREDLLAPLVVSSESDLQYQVIHSLSDTENLEILDTVLTASDTTDLVLKRKALETWYRGLENQKFSTVQSYVTNKLHYLIRATYEMQLDGKFLKNALSFANLKELPTPKAYPDFIIRYLTELLGNWEYDPEAYNSLHALVVPSYFTFDTSNDEEAPFVIL